ncbi:MAG: A24 family peptidase [Actinomycetota bacterium]|nr:A24 family peptidase [Actinomycetota bacterium]
MSNVLIALLLFVFGLVIGPLLGVVVDRAVDRERLVAEHRCPSCRASLGAAALIPLRHWFLRCPDDETHRQHRYWLVDFTAAAAFATAGLRFGWSWELAPYLGLFAALVVMSVIDLETHLLLNILTYPALFAGIFVILLLSGPTGTEARIWPAIVGGAVYGGVLGAAFLVYPPGLGLGDVKLAPTLGLFLG